MSFLARFARFWYDFVVGDDWRLAAGALVTIAATWFATHRGANAWWFPPLGVTALLSVSIAVAARRTRNR
jgi:hypothetical protein